MHSRGDPLATISKGLRCNAKNTLKEGRRIKKKTNLQVGKILEGQHPYTNFYNLQLGQKLYTIYQGFFQKHGLSIISLFTLKSCLVLTRAYLSIG